MTVDYFIRKFKAIPENRWITDQLSDWEGRHCSIGYCNGPEEVDAFYRLFMQHFGVSPVHINDGKDSRYPQLTPKTRVLAALETIKQRLG